MDKNWVITQSLNSCLYSYKLSQTETAIFISTKQEKNKYGSYSNSYNYFFHCTPANIQNNDIKLSVCTFRLDVTRFLHRGKFVNPKNSFTDFYNQPYTVLPFLSFNCTLMVVVTRFSLGRPKFTNWKIKGVRIFICNIKNKN